MAEVQEQTAETPKTTIRPIPPREVARVSTSDGWQLESNDESQEDLEGAVEEQERAAAAEKEGKSPGERVTEAAKELGSRGGKAAAKAKEEKEDSDEEEGTEAKADDDKEEQGKKDRRGDPRHDPKARMLEATRKEAEAKRQLAAERARVQQLAEKNKQLERDIAERLARLEQGNAPKPKPAPQNGDGAPRPEDFESYEDFVDARSEWKIKRTLADQQKLQKQQAEMSQYQKDVETAVTRFNEAAQKARTAVPDYDVRVAEVSSQLVPTFTLPPGSRPGPLNVAADEIISSEVAPDLLLYYSEHEDELQRLATLPNPQAIARAVAKTEAKLGAATTDRPAPVAPVSKAPPPIRSVSGTPPAADPYEHRDDDDFDTFFEKELARQRRPGR